jgi:TonB family protein
MRRFGSEPTKAIEISAFADNYCGSRAVQRPSSRKSQCKSSRVSFPPRSGSAEWVFRRALFLAPWAWFVLSWGALASAASPPADAASSSPAAEPASPSVPSPPAAPAPAPVFVPPRLIHFVEAVPPASFTGRSQAEVVLTIDVDEAGGVTSVQVTRSAGGEGAAELDRAAVEAARQFTFTPGLADGRAVPVRITYSYRFVLKPPTPPPVPSPASASSGTSGGPTAPLYGLVLKRGDRSPVTGVAAIVLLAPGDERRAVTDQEGRFSFDALPAGEHPLALRGPGIAPIDATVSLHEGKRLDVTTFVDVKERYASTVRGRRSVLETVEQTLVTEEIKRIPGTQGDTLKAVQNLPGVARAPFGIGLLPVWGSAPEDTRVYVDGVSVPLLYHFGGLRSIVNSEMVQSLTFVPGAYEATHGLGLGGLVDVTTRQPRSDGSHGYAQMDVLDGSALLEGPLTRTLSFAVAARRSWIDATLPLFTTSSLQLTPVYYDYQATLAWRPSPHDDVDVLFLGSDDRVQVLARIKNRAIDAAIGSHSYFHRAIVDWTHRFAPRGTLSLTGSLGYDVPMGLGVEFGQAATSIDQHALSYTLRAVASWPFTEALRVSGGVDFEGQRFTLDRSGPTSVVVDPAAAAGSAGMGSSAGFDAQGSGYATDHLALYGNAVAPFVTSTISVWSRRLTLTPQFRLQIFTFAANPGSPDAVTKAFVSPEPRVMLRVRISARVVIKGAAGAYSQAPDPAAFSAVFGNPQLVPERGTQYVLGAEVDVTPSLHAEVEGFYKDLRRLVVTADAPGEPLLDNDGKGRAYGGQVLVRQELARSFFGWLSYTLSRSERRDHPGEAWHPFQFDQTHILSLMLSQHLPRGFQVGGRFRYVTGTPYTPVVGSFYDTVAGRYTPITGARFGGRLASFNQLDLRVDKTFTFDRWRFSAYLDVQNLLRADNPEAVAYNYDYRRTHAITGLPLLPIIGIRGDF